MPASFSPAACNCRRALNSSKHRTRKAISRTRSKPATRSSDATYKGASDTGLPFRRPNPRSPKYSSR